MGINKIKEFAIKLNKTKVFDLLDGYLGLMNNISNGLLDGEMPGDGDPLMNDCVKKAKENEEELDRVIKECKQINDQINDSKIKANIGSILKNFEKIDKLQAFYEEIDAIKKSNQKIKNKKANNANIRKELKELEKKF